MTLMLMSTMLWADETITVSANSSDISEGLDLKVVAKLFAEAKNLEEFETMLNNPDSAFCNLDLNGDGQVDYLRVVETGEGNKRLIVLQAILAKDIFQDVASIYVEKDENNEVSVQVIGDEYVYGENYIIEPVYVYRPVIYDWFWSDLWYAWHSPWYWGYYPGWWYVHNCWSHDWYWRHCYAFHHHHHYCSFRHGHHCHNAYHDLHSRVSHREYAVAHPSGGWYYPNAVMPYRGLLESEAYAHAFIADLLRDRESYFDRRTDEAEARSIADGISLWLMIQKETQHWDDDAAFVNAIATILDASQETLDTRIISLSKTFTKPFEEVKAASNGFTVERRFFVERTVDGKVQRNELSDGEQLSIGDKVFAEYRIWNEENRSFVKLTAPRPANLRPANQLSGQYGWWLRPLSVAGWRAFTPHGYRSVLADRTEYWFDVYPEENTVVTEEFLVTQAGSFQTPAVSIESLYAPHYRANDRGRGPLLSE